MGILDNQKLNLKFLMKEFRTQNPDERYRFIKKLYSLGIKYEYRGLKKNETEYIVKYESLEPIEL